MQYIKTQLFHQILPHATLNNSHLIQVLMYQLAIRLYIIPDKAHKYGLSLT